MPDLNSIYLKGDVPVTARASASAIAATMLGEGRGGGEKEEEEERHLKNTDTFSAALSSPHKWLASGSVLCVLIGGYVLATGFDGLVGALSPFGDAGTSGVKILFGLATLFFGLVVLEIIAKIFVQIQKASRYLEQQQRERERQRQRQRQQQASDPSGSSHHAVTVNSGVVASAPLPVPFTSPAHPAHPTPTSAPAPVTPPPLPDRRPDTTRKRNRGAASSSSSSSAPPSVAGGPRSGADIANAVATMAPLGVGVPGSSSTGASVKVGVV